MHPDSGEEPPRISAEEVERLYEELAAGLGGFLQSLLGSEADAADCLQNCFTLLVQRGGECAPAARRAWLYQVARNQAALAQRRAAIHRRALQRAELEQGSPDRGSPDRGPSDRGRSEAGSAEAGVLGAMLAEERREEVRLAIRSLPDAQRQVVELRIGENLTFQEIANRLEIPLGTALGRMRGALKRLAQVLQEEGARGE
ncbi:RNA polymerase sigma factor [Candidatus Laterigemmans baculatus]|uniref:RNA polymerase sigma factor n=1 Tax=Candidatus Laterigemmans baculatus TaxID=2770505 RepID=UPI0013DB8F0D|nr:RNA polymerase sigma factor [Candidatus Laterigemmans baculatus]